MSTYRGNNLFGSGPHRFHVGGLAQRRVEHTIPGADGVRIGAMGRTGRTITQTGTLIADDVAGLDALTAAIEVALDGETGDLVDDLARTWSHTVMLEFKPGEVRRVGSRVMVDYSITYTQVRT